MTRGGSSLTGMAKKTSVEARTLVTPIALTDLSSEVEEVEDGKGVAYWKHILPEKAISYHDGSGKTRTINFDREYLSDLVAAHGDDSIGTGVTPFMLADTDNRHTMDPERYRGEVAAMRLAEGDEEPGLWAKIRFSSKAAAKAVMENPKLGVSARIREGIDRSDGKTWKRGIIHVLGTLDPKIPNLAGWKPALDFAGYSDNLLDLSGAEYTEELVAETDWSTDEVPDIDAVDEADIENFTDAQLAAFIAAYADHVDITDSTEDGDEDEDSEDEQQPASAEYESDAPEGDRELQEAALSNTRSLDLDFANAQAAEANGRATEALRRMAEIQWGASRAEYLRAGVPPFLLDLAEPVLNRPSDMVIDLSNSDEEDINVATIVRGLLDAAKGTIDFANERGHGGSESSGDDPDAAVLAAFERDFPIN